MTSIQSTPTLLLIDNYDSFTYNIAQYFSELKQNVVVWKNDAASIKDIKELNPDSIIIGPGPCTPNEAGISLNVIEEFAAKTPILGICLGHQAIGQVFGGTIIKAQQVMHGRLSKVYHNNTGVFTHLDCPFKATRYHSLVIDKNNLPDSLEITAWTQTNDGLYDDKTMGEIMGIRHISLAVEGVQFHPESILSEAGYLLLNNFLKQHGLAILDNNELPTVG